ncbi:MAG: DNA translocase FtsK 4TM domain-containing protein [Candidatus Babeliaceae bacterium]|nr:DNA translocase FtsK 4TM domain-containing protein [Candidatus Babeliaceae bacterium]
MKDLRRSIAKLVPFLIFLLALFSLLSLLFFRAEDPSSWTDVAAVDECVTANIFGSIGSFLAAWLFVTFGYGAYIFVVLLGAIACFLWGYPHENGDMGRLVGLVLILIGFSALVAPIPLISVFGVPGGGVVGLVFLVILEQVFDNWIAVGFALMLLASGMILLFRFTWLSLFLGWIVSGCRWVGDAWCWFCPKEVSPESIFGDPVWHEAVRKPTSIATAENIEQHPLPSLSLFQVSDDLKSSHIESESVSLKNQLEQVLHRHGVPGKVVVWRRGPVVTLFEYAPGPSVKVAHVCALEDDLALALGVLSVRIIAPIPGKTVIGIELANEKRETVFAADMLQRQEGALKGKLPLLIGADTAGRDLIVDLTTMPHLLVAGSTGSGKSVALNTILAGLLYTKTPEEMRLILIDPKRLEFASYVDLPHLLFPVVTEVMQVPRVLQWLVAEMESRYKKLAEAGVRQIAEYHGVVPLPYLVVVIDELADIMVTIGRDVEPLLARLAQMARAAGIHLIVATQRPSVDVITGVVKVNFPSRLAFKVASKIDSRTILDVPGAERLLGKGDLLFLTTQGVGRYHGALVRDTEISSLVDFWKSRQRVTYESFDVITSGDSTGGAEDPLYDEVVAFVQTVDEVSISLVQRRFRIGFNRSARLIEMLTERGILLTDRRGRYRKVARSA